MDWSSLLVAASDLNVVGAVSVPMKLQWMTTAMDHQEFQLQRQLQQIQPAEGDQSVLRHRHLLKGNCKKKTHLQAFATLAGGR